MTREQALALGAERKAARRARTGRIRKGVAIVAVAAFLGPFGLIFKSATSSSTTQVASTKAVAAVTTNSTASTTTTATTTPTAVTTQQS